MGEMLRYAWRGSGKHWATSWVNAIGALVGAAIIEAAGVRLEIGNEFASKVLTWAIGAVLGVAVLFLPRMCWWRFHRAFDRRGGLAVALKERFGANMWPIILMATGIILFVLLFGGGALWYVWPKPNPAQSSQPFTIGDAQNLAALHWRQAASDFGTYLYQ
jgi:hypothetical protein